MFKIVSAKKPANLVIKTNLILDFTLLSVQRPTAYLRNNQWRIKHKLEEDANSMISPIKIIFTTFVNYKKMLFFFVQSSLSNSP